jgi:hypothetical protein
MNIACYLINDNHRYRFILSTEPSFLGISEPELDYMGFDRGGPSVRKARTFNWGLN